MSINNLKVGAKYSSIDGSIRYILYNTKNATLYIHIYPKGYNSCNFLNTWGVRELIKRL